MVNKFGLLGGFQIIFARFQRNLSVSLIAALIRSVIQLYHVNGLFIFRHCRTTEQTYVSSLLLNYNCYILWTHDFMMLLHEMVLLNADCSVFDIQVTQCKKPTYCGEGD